MRIAFHATLKPPDHPVPSGDRQVARTLIAALERAGHKVLVASSLRTWARTPEEHAARTAEAEAELPEVITRVRAFGAQVWLTYHCYYKAADLLGPRVVAELGLGHVIVEPSLANKRSTGPWAEGHAAARSAIASANALLCPSRDDLERVAEAAGPGARLDVLPPALHPQAEPRTRFAIRPDPVRVSNPTCPGSSGAPMDRRFRALGDCAMGPLHEAGDVGEISGGPRLLAVGMMREGDKLASYRLLGEALALLGDQPWHLVVVGDGPVRAEVEAALPAGRTTFLGALDAAAVRAVQEACDIAVWPGIGEAYGIALLEAQAAGKPVVAGRLRGIPDVVSGGILVRPDDPQAMADGIAALLRDPVRRQGLGRIAKETTAREHSLEAMARRLDVALDWAARRGKVAA